MAGLSQTSQHGPSQARSSDKPEASVLKLRDVNRCSVRPTDLITHRNYAVLVTNTRGRIDGEKEGFFFQVGMSRASLRFRRDPSGATDVEVIDGGGLHVLRPAVAFTPGIDRVAAALRAALNPAEAVTLAGHNTAS